MRDYITLAQAGRLVPGNASPRTIWRWARYGVLSRAGNRVRLAHVRIGAKLYTTTSDLESFFRELSATDLVALDDGVKTTVDPRRPDLGGRRESSQTDEVARSESRVLKAIAKVGFNPNSSAGRSPVARGGHRRGSSRDGS